MRLVPARLDLQDYRTGTRQGHKWVGGSGDGQEQVVEPDPFVPRAPPKHSMQRPSPASALAVPVSEQHKAVVQWSSGRRRSRTTVVETFYSGGGGRGRRRRRRRRRRRKVYSKLTQ